MLREIRLKKIIKIMKEKQNAAIDDLAEQLEVSKDTIRRDLMKLEENFCAYDQCLARNALHFLTDLLMTVNAEQHPGGPMEQKI